MAAIALVTVATTVIARYASSRVRSAAPNTPPEALTVTAPVPAPVPAPAPVTPVQRPHAAKADVEKPKQSRVVTTARSREHSVPLAPPAGAATSGDGESSSRTVAAEPGTSASAVESTATPDAQAPVTITGCLETTVDGAEFRLTDTEGIDAPKTRSWRSGFLKKRAAPVQLLELSDPRGLQKYVGHRVVATGLLTSRELRVRSLQSAGSSCKLE